MGALPSGCFFSRSTHTSLAAMKAAIWLMVIVLEVVQSAPRSKTKTLPQTVYDQKQTGDYNIQLHLKDFQIIALLADESLGSLGDYDYNYDYSDFTVKPPINVTLKPPPEEVSTSTTEKLPLVYNTNEEKPVLNATSTKIPEKSTTTEEPIIVASTLIPNSPDKIKVQIIQGPSSPNIQDIAIVPSDDLGLLNDGPALGEILHYRRCASGYSRDKKGRCRRLRRPVASNPFDISRLASNLAARFRQTSSESISTSAESDSAED